MIEQQLKDLTEAITENTQVLKAMLAASATAVPALPGVPYTEPEVKPAKVKKEKPAPAPGPEPKPEETPSPDDPDDTEPVAPVEEEAPETLSRDEWLTKIKGFVRAQYAASGDELLSKKKEYEGICREFGIKNSNDLTLEQCPDFWNAIQKL